MGGARMFTVAGVFAILGLLLWPSDRTNVSAPEGAAVLVNGATRQATASPDGARGTDRSELPVLAAAEAVGPTAPASTMPTGTQGASSCSDATADVVSASGAHAGSISAWVDVANVSIDVSSSITAVTWELAASLPETIYGADDAFAWSVWTAVLTGATTDLQVIIRLDGTSWTTLANDLSNRNHAIPGRVDPEANRLTATFETAALGPLDPELSWFARAEVGPPGLQIDPVYDRLTDSVCEGSSATLTLG